jgi:acyl dehydratase
VNPYVFIGQMTEIAARTFDDLPVPLPLGSTFFSPAIEQVRKFAYAIEDETGWLVGDPADALVHPLFLSTYMWFPSGFYLRAPGEIGHFGLFRQHYGHLVGTPFLHGKSSARFLRPFRLGRPIRADVTVTEKHRRRGRDFIVMRASFFDADGVALAVFDHGCAIRSHEVPRAAPPSPTPVATSPSELPSRHIEMSLEKSRLFSLPAENYHTHDHLAQAMGVRVAIPAAMMSFAYLSRFAQDIFGDDAWISRGGLDATFTRMLQRDDVLSVEGRRKDGASLALSIYNSRREPVAVATACLLDLP